MENQANKKLIVWIIAAVAVLAVIAAIIWQWQTQAPQEIAPPVTEQPLPSKELAPAAPPAPSLEADTTTTLNQELETVNIGDLNTEFKDIDTDLQGL